MTENEAKEYIQGKLDCMNKCDVFDFKGTDECDGCNYCYSQGNFGEQKKALETAIKALEEIQQYRAIGTVEELKAIRQWKADVMGDFCRYDVSSFDELVANARNKAIDEFVSTLVPKLTDAIYQRDVESMTNLINCVAEELKAGVDDED